MRRRLPIDNSSNESEYAESDTNGSVTLDPDLIDNETSNNKDSKLIKLERKVKNTKILNLLALLKRTKRYTILYIILRKLAKKYGLKKIGQDKTYIYVEDLTRALKTNLIITKKQYSSGRY
ncbi:hypothetical protein BU23DRAFT_649914 [Bimuria novae-zelandiae CBS 107.79]|uniref:Uncharacterized protein n=1 Tax=Bimuria novae-zelandiae CBS 107.79 TaxID=1447943 RepID=A0A6A5VAP9_9PLEO|nr:hypothetical protein BU23DRAFT_649914 [Bimuria novae-zelandiae CBS 107.79]